MTQIFGILNITEDSFSDGGRYLQMDQSLQHAFELHEKGAHTIDIGGAPSNPKAKVVSPELEWERIIRILPQLINKNLSISVDSCRTEVQRKALAHDVDYLNDITGFSDPSFYPELADSQASLVVMHSIQGGEKASEEVISPDLILKRIFDFFDGRVESLLNAGIPTERLILDPGMGFFLGADHRCSVRVLNSIQTLKLRYKLPVLISVSRKSFLGAITSKPVNERQAATLSAEIVAIQNGADYIRTHDPAAITDAIHVLNSIAEEKKAVGNTEILR